MSILSFGTINKKILFAVFGGIFKFICNIVLYHSKSKMNSHPCILGINAGIGLSLAIIPLIYIKMRSRSRNLIDSLSNITTKELLIFNDTNDFVYVTKVKTKIPFLFIIAFLDFSQKFLGFFFSSLYVENFWIFDSFILLLFSYLILKTKVYAHHFVSLIIIIVLGIILIWLIYFDRGVGFWEIFITLSTEILFGLEIVIFKYTMETKFSSPYESCFCVGFFEIIMNLLLLIIFSNVSIHAPDYFNKANDDYIDKFSLYNEKVDFIEVLLFILTMLSRCIFILFGFITVNYFTPLHVVLILIMGEISFLFIDEVNWIIYIKIPIFIILIFFILIFVEIIELNIFGLQKNTKKNIIQRSESDIINDRSRYSTDDDINNRIMGAAEMQVI